MVEPMKKSESEDESEEKQWKSLTESIVNQHDDRIRRLEERKIKVLEERIKWLQEQNIRRSDEIEGLYLRLEAIEAGNNTGFRHENDGGYFD